MRALRRLWRWLRGERPGDHGYGVVTIDSYAPEGEFRSHDYVEGKKGWRLAPFYRNGIGWFDACSDTRRIASFNERHVAEVIYAEPPA